MQSLGYRIENWERKLLLFVSNPTLLPFFPVPVSVSIFPPLLRFFLFLLFFVGGLGQGGGSGRFFLKKSLRERGSFMLTDLTLMLFGAPSFAPDDSLNITILLLIIFTIAISRKIKIFTAASSNIESILPVNRTRIQYQITMERKSEAWPNSGIG